MPNLTLLDVRLSGTPLDFWFDFVAGLVEVSDVGPSGPFVAKAAAQNGQAWAEYVGGTKVFSFYYDPDAVGLFPEDEPFLRIAYNGVELSTTLDLGPYQINNPLTTVHHRIYATLPV